MWALATHGTQEDEPGSWSGIPGSTSFHVRSFFKPEVFQLVPSENGKKDGGYEAYSKYPEVEEKIQNDGCLPVDIFRPPGKRNCLLQRLCHLVPLRPARYDVCSGVSHLPCQVGHWGPVEHNQVKLNPQIVFRPIGAGVEPDSLLKINPLPPTPTKAPKKTTPKNDSPSKAKE